MGGVMSNEGLNFSSAQALTASLVPEYHPVFMDSICRQRRTKMVATRVLKDWMQPRIMNLHPRRRSRVSSMSITMGWRSRSNLP